MSLVQPGRISFTITVGVFNLEVNLGPEKMRVDVFGGKCGFVGRGVFGGRLEPLCNRR